MMPKGSSPCGCNDYKQYTALNEMVTNGVVRLFVGKAGSYYLYKEVPVPTTPILSATPTPAPIMNTSAETLAQLAGI